MSAVERAGAVKMGNINTSVTRAVWYLHSGMVYDRIRLIDLDILVLWIKPRYTISLNLSNGQKSDFPRTVNEITSRFEYV